MSNRPPRRLGLSPFQPLAAGRFRPALAGVNARLTMDTEPSNFVYLTPAMVWPIEPRVCVNIAMSKTSPNHLDRDKPSVSPAIGRHVPATSTDLPTEVRTSHAPAPIPLNHDRFVRLQEIWDVLRQVADSKSARTGHSLSFTSGVRREGEAPAEPAPRMNLAFSTGAGSAGASLASPSLSQSVSEHLNWATATHAKHLLKFACINGRLVSRLVGRTILPVRNALEATDGQECPSYDHAHNPTGISRLVQIDRVRREHRWQPNTQKWLFTLLDAPLKTDGRREPTAPGAIAERLPTITTRLKTLTAGIPLLFRPWYGQSPAATPVREAFAPCSAVALYYEKRITESPHSIYLLAAPLPAWRGRHVQPMSGPLALASTTAPAFAASIASHYSRIDREPSGRTEREIVRTVVRMISGSDRANGTARGTPAGVERTETMRQPLTPPTLLPPDLVQKLTEQVVSALDSRRLAERERFGRF